jgi:hypothetical protein
MRMIPGSGIVLNARPTPDQSNCARADLVGVRRGGRRPKISRGREKPRPSSDHTALSQAGWLAARLPRWCFDGASFQRARAHPSHIFGKRPCAWFLLCGRDYSEVTETDSAWPHCIIEHGCDRPTPRAASNTSSLSSRRRQAADTENHGAALLTQRDRSQYLDFVCFFLPLAQATIHAGLEFPDLWVEKGGCGSSVMQISPSSTVRLPNFGRPFGL